MQLREATFRQAQGVVARVCRKGERLNVWEGGEQCRCPTGNTKCSYGGEGIDVERTSEGFYKVVVHGVELQAFQVWEVLEEVEQASEDVGGGS